MENLVQNNANQDDAILSQTAGSLYPINQLEQLSSIIGNIDIDSEPIEISDKQLIECHIKDFAYISQGRIKEWVQEKFLVVQSHLKEFKHERLPLLYQPVIMVLHKYFESLKINDELQQENIQLRATLSLPENEVRNQLAQYIIQNEGFHEKTALIEYIDYEENTCRVPNNNRDIVYREWRINNALYYYMELSNTEIAKRMQLYTHIPQRTIENVLSQINTFFVTAKSNSWLTAQYVHDMDHYLKSQGYGYLNADPPLLDIKYADKIPNTTQIISYGQKLHVKTKNGATV